MLAITVTSLMIHMLPQMCYRYGHLQYHEDNQ